MATLWMLLELANLIIFTLFILPRRQPADARPLLPFIATQLLRLTFLYRFWRLVTACFSSTSLALWIGYIW